MPNPLEEWWRRLWAPVTNRILAFNRSLPWNQTPEMQRRYTPANVQAQPPQQQGSQGATGVSPIGQLRQAAGNLPASVIRDWPQHLGPPPSFGPPQPFTMNLPFSPVQQATETMRAINMSVGRYNPLLQALASQGPSSASLAVMPQTAGFGGIPTLMPTSIPGAPIVGGFGGASPFTQLMASSSPAALAMAQSQMSGRSTHRTSPRPASQSATSGRSARRSSARPTARPATQPISRPPISRIGRTPIPINPLLAMFAARR